MQGGNGISMPGGGPGPRGGAGPPMRLSAFVSLKNRNFLYYWVGMLFSFNAMQMQVVARGWLVYTMTDSPLSLGLVSAGFGVPIVLFSLYGGAVADRVRKRNLLIFTRTCMALVSLVITLLIVTDTIEVWHLVVSSVASGAIMSFYGPGRQAFVLELVGKDALLNAIAMNSMAMNICRIASPALAGVLLKVIGIPGVYWLITISGALVVVTLWMIPANEKITVRPDTPLLKDVIEGLRYVKGNSVILILLLIGFIPILTAMPYQMLMPVFARTVFKAGETGLGFLMSAVGIGALCGSLIVASLGNFNRKGLIQFLAGGVFGLFLIAFGLSGSLRPAFVFLLFVGGGSSMFMTLTNTLIMTNTPEELVGRVMSISMMTFGMMPLGTLPAGAFAEAFGAPLTVMVGGGLLLLFLFAIFITQPKVRHLE